MARWWPVYSGKSGARVWRGDGLHRKEASPSAIDAEAERLSWLAAQGFPCPRIVEHKPGVPASDSWMSFTAGGRRASNLWSAMAIRVCRTSSSTTKAR